MRSKPKEISTTPKKNRPSVTDNESYSPISGSAFESENNFSFSPELRKKAKEGLAEILTDRPKPERPKVTKKTLTHLYDRAKEFASLKEKKTNAIFNEYHPFQPKLNQQSLKMVKLAKKEGKDLHHSKKIEPINPQPSPDEFLQQPKQKISLKGFIERNYKAPLERSEARKVPQYIETLDRVDEACTFRPSLDRKSLQMTKSHKADLYTRSMKMTEEKKQLIEKTKEEIDNRIMSNCTFTPKIIKDINAISKVKSRNNSESRKYSARMKSYDQSPFRFSIVECIDDLNQ